MLTSEKKEQIRQSLRKWVSSHQEVGKQIEKATSELAELLKLDEIRNPNNMIRPIVDRTTFTVSWQGQTCQLGNTLLFWLFYRLVRSTNCYVAHVELLDDVWHGAREASTIRGVVKRLRDQLTASGMEKLASAIDGSVSGYYGLMIV